MSYERKETDVSKLDRQEQVEVYEQMAELEDRLGHEQSAEDYRRRVKRLKEEIVEAERPKAGLYEFKKQSDDRVRYYYFRHDGQNFLDSMRTPIDASITENPDYTVTRVRTLADDEVAVKANLVAADSDAYAETLVWKSIAGTSIPALQARKVIKAVHKAAKDAGFFS